MAEEDREREKRRISTVVCFDKTCTIRGPRLTTELHEKLGNRTKEVGVIVESLKKARRVSCKQR
jgi:hypothetical protein